MVNDVTRESAKKLGEAFKVKWTDSLEEVLANPEVEVINICTPSGLHRDGAIAGARAGKHLVIEKPLEITLVKCDEIIRVAQEEKVKVGVIFPSRFKEGSQRLKKAAEEKRFGRIALADAYVKWYRTQEYYDSGAWRGTWPMDGGGALMNQSIHTIDLLQWFMGEVEGVTAYTKAISHKIETEDTACAIVRFRNGALGVIEGTTSSYPGTDARIAIHGENGTVILDDGKIKEWIFKEATPSDKELKNTDEVSSSGAVDPTKNLGYEFHRRQINDMVEAIRHNREPLVNGEEGRKSVEIILAIYESSRTGREVKLPLL
jgi:predicted dehydrogenase